MLIVPDIHGRKFWKEPLAEHFMVRQAHQPIKEDATVGESAESIDRKVIFLGDYLDPYGNESISVVAALDRFKQIIRLKKEHSDDIILLLGNHDWSYIFPDKFHTSRHDSFFEDEAHHLFLNNIDLFQMFYQCDIGKHYLFSHAGIHPEWMENNVGISDIAKVIEIYNQRPTDIPSHYLNHLACVSYKRGGLCAVGSPIWCDVTEFDGADLDDSYYQIFGHTQQEDVPIITEDYACLDCRKVFTLNNDGGLS